MEYDIELELEIEYTIEPGQEAVVDFAGMLISPKVDDVIEITDIKLFGESVSHKQHQAILDKHREDIEDRIWGEVIIRREEAEINRRINKNRG